MAKKNVLSESPSTSSGRTGGGVDGVTSTPIPAFPLQGGRSEVSVAFYGGPYEVRFCGRMWFRELSQVVTDKEWAAMQQHPHFGQFDFKVKE